MWPRSVTGLRLYLARKRARGNRVKIVSEKGKCLVSKRKGPLPLNEYQSGSGAGRCLEVIELRADRLRCCDDICSEDVVCEIFSC